MSLLLFLGSSREAGVVVGGEDGVLLEVQLVGVWTDIAADVLAAEHIRGHRGINGTTPLDCVSGTGRLAFTMRNDAGNSGGVAGWYSPNHPQARAGWTFGIPCRVRYRANDVIYPLWYGKVRTILPTPGVKGPRRVAVTAQGGMGDLAQARIRRVVAQFDQTEQQLLSTVYAMLPSGARPPSLNFDPGLDVYPVVFDDLADGSNGLQLVTDIVRSTGGGRLFETADGTHRYLNRQTVSQTDSSLSLTDATLSAVGGDFSVPSSLAQVYSRVEVTANPKTFGVTDTVVLYASSSVVRVTAGATQTVTGTFTDPANSLRTVGGKDFQPITAYTDYEANTLATGLGTDVTGGVTVSAEAWGSSVDFTITNSLGYEVFLVSGSGATQGTARLQLRGRPIYALGPLTVEAGEDEDYFARVLSVDLPYQDDVNIAQDLAARWHTMYSQLGRQVDAVTVNPQRVGMAATLARDVGQVITVSETMTGLVDATLMINAIDFDIHPARPGGYVFLTWRTAPMLADEVWILDDPVKSVLDSTTILGWG